MDVPKPKNLTSAPSVSSSSRKLSMGAIVTLVIVVAIIIIGAFYVWGEQVAEEQRLISPVQGE